MSSPRSTTREKPQELPLTLFSPLRTCVALQRQEVNA
jgi:hypothetical protein